MTSEDPRPDFFLHGTRWVRADFHLHTRADKREWEDTGDPERFPAAYAGRLAAEDVRVGVVTNHNKFDREEFRALRRAARREDIFLLPGVELSVDDGASGIHVLVVFEPETWLDSKCDTDWINSFLDVAFHDSGVSNRADANARCRWNLKRLLDELHQCRDKHGRDSFLVLAHVEQDNGFFKEMGARVVEFKNHALFRESVLGLQKVRTRDRQRVWRDQLGGPLPAFVEGSDPKTLAAVGVAQKCGGEEQRCYLHLGAFTFDAVKLALTSHPYRVAPAPRDVKHAHIHTMTVEGGGSAGVRATWHLNAGLNNLIGIRGSGKSTLLELLRYGLGVDLRGPWTTQPADEPYKLGLIQRHLGSGGEVRLGLRCGNDHEYEVRRILGEAPKVYHQGALKSDLRASGGLLDVLYFGQKDLSELGREERNADLIEKFYAGNLREPREAARARAEEVREQVGRLLKQVSTLERREEFLAMRARAEESLRVFEEKNVADKLRRQVAFQNDVALLGEMHAGLAGLAEQLKELQDERSAEFDGYFEATSTENPEEIAAAQAALAPARLVLTQLEEGVKTLRVAGEQVSELRDGVQRRQRDLTEEFAAIRRSIGEADGSLNADSYVDLKRRLRAANLSLEELDRQEVGKQKTQTALVGALEALRAAWRTEFLTVEAQVRELNGRDLPIHLEIRDRGNKARFEEYLKELARGTGVPGTALKQVTESFIDPIEIYRDMEAGGDRWTKAVPAVGQRQKLEERIRGALAEFLTFRVPDRLDLTLRDKPLKDHSLGQRTSALVLFLLEKGGYDLLLIDQPEDDLDNQTIYQDVIHRLRILKREHQFVFATHNANLPVLGEAEMVGSCRYGPAGLDLKEGSTDQPPIQQDIISVMEGGEEAFRLRKQIYQQWRH